MDVELWNVLVRNDAGEYRAFSICAVDAILALKLAQQKAGGTHWKAVSVQTVYEGGAEGANE